MIRAHRPGQPAWPGAAQQGRRGLTLVEVMIATLLAGLIILLAAAAFRSITRTFAAVNRLSTENELLRTGFWLCLNEADFWSSYADDRVPYCKEWMRQARHIATDPEGRKHTASDSMAKRLFAPVVFAGTTGRWDLAGRLWKSKEWNGSQIPVWVERVPAWGAGAEPVADTYNPDYDDSDGNYLKVVNPNGLLPHHPSSWMRNAVVPGEGLNLRAPHLTKIDPLNPNQTESWRITLDMSSGPEDGPSFGTPRLKTGDYGLCSATEMRDGRLVNRFREFRAGRQSPGGRGGRGGSQPVADPIKDIAGLTAPASGQYNSWNANLDNAKRPRLMHQIFQRLGYWGVHQYMPRGCLTIYNDQHGDLPSHRAQPTLDDGAQAPPDIPDPTNPSTQGPFRWDACRWYNNFYGGAISYSDRWNSNQPHFYEYSSQHLCAQDWHILLGEWFDTGTFDAVHTEQDCGWTWAFFFKPTMASTYTVAGANWGHSGLMNFDQAYNGQPYRLTGSATFAGRWVDWETAHPVEHYPGTDLRRLYGVSSRTQFLPLNYTDQEIDYQQISTQLGSAKPGLFKYLDLVSKPPKAPQMRTFVTRYGALVGGDLNTHIVEIETEGQPVLPLLFSTLGASYRGARQHWALTHLRAGGTAETRSSLRVDDRGKPQSDPAGDFYE